jgi:2-polyprenyl-6-methoxyphenol hydroxylase-like FAD-dependent oxidoreductase
VNASSLRTDVLVAGGGLAGSIAASMLARAGFDVVLVDPHACYPQDLRCEKLDSGQVAILRRTGLADLVLPATTFDGNCWVARFGRVVDRRPGDQYGILYDKLVNTVRATIPAKATFVRGLVTRIVNTEDRQEVTTSGGETFSARLVIVANGLNSGLRTALGMPRKDVSRHHCVTFAFDMKPAGRARFEFGALTYYPERASDRLAYVTLFPIGAFMRANLFAYRAISDPWLREMRDMPQRTMLAVMPGLGPILGNFEVAGAVKVRPADLYVTTGCRVPGIVLVGDAFATSCPAAGTGADKVLTDVERLCNVHVPRWMATPGMDAQKISAFYDDPVKQACDRMSADLAFNLRSTSIDEGVLWRARRWGRFAARYAIGAARSTLAADPHSPGRQTR